MEAIIKFYDKNFNNVNFENQNFKRALFYKCSFDKTILIGADLTGCDFNRSSLEGAILDATTKLDDLSFDSLVGFKGDGLFIMESHEGLHEIVCTVDTIYLRTYADPVYPEGTTVIEKIYVSRDFDNRVVFTSSDGSKKGHSPDWTINPDNIVRAYKALSEAQYAAGAYDGYPSYYSTMPVW